MPGLFVFFFLPSSSLPALPPLASFSISAHAVARRYQVSRVQVSQAVAGLCQSPEVEASPPASGSPCLAAPPARIMRSNIYLHAFLTIIY